MSWSRRRGGRDPLVYLIPFGALGAVGAIFPAVEHVLNLIVGTAAVILVVGTTGYIVWAIWWPLPELELTEEPQATRWGNRWIIRRPVAELPAAGDGALS